MPAGPNFPTSLPALAIFHFCFCFHSSHPYGCEVQTSFFKINKWSYWVPPACLPSVSAFEEIILQRRWCFEVIGFLRVTSGNCLSQVLFWQWQLRWNIQNNLFSPTFRNSRGCFWKISTWSSVNSDFQVPPKLTSFPGGASGKEPVTNSGRHKRHRFDPWVRKICQKDGMATHSSILAWRIPWTKKSLAGCSPWGCRESGTAEAT